MSDRFVFGGRTYEYAGFGRRVGAAVLDGVFFFIGVPLLLGLIGITVDTAEGATVLYLALFGALFIYFQVCEWQWGQTMAKNALGLRVMTLDADKPDASAAAVRNALRFVDGPLTLLFITPVIVDRSPRHQRLGDRAADTIVVREPQPDPAPVATEQTAAPRAAEIFPAATGALAAVSPPEPPSPAGPPPESAGAEPAPPPPEPAPERERRRLPYADWPLRRTVQGVLAGILLGGLLLPIPVLVADPELDSYAGLIAAQAILGVTLIGAALVVAGVSERGPRQALSRLGLRRVGPSGLGWAALAYFGYLVLIAIYASFVVEPNQEDIARDLGLDAGVLTAAFSVLLIAFVAPLSEELFFRGLLYGGLRVRLGPILAALISGAVFGGLHATTGLTAVPPLVIFGVALALLYEKTGSLWPPIFLHFVNNSIALAVSA